MFPISQFAGQGLGVVLGALAEQAVAVQNALNLDYQSSVQGLLSDKKPEDPQVARILDLLGPALSAPRLRVGSFTIDLRCETAWRRSREGAIQVRPVNLGWELARGTNSATATRIRLEVEQVPLPANPSSPPASDTLT